MTSHKRGIKMAKFMFHRRVGSRYFVQVGLILLSDRLYLMTSVKSKATILILSCSPASRVKTWWLYLFYLYFVQTLNKASYRYSTKKFHQFIGVIRPASQHFSQYKSFLPRILVECPWTNGWPTLTYGVMKQSCT